MKNKIFIYFFLAFAIINITIYSGHKKLDTLIVDEKKIETNNIYSISSTVASTVYTSNEKDLFLDNNEIVAVFNSSNIKIYLTESDIDLMAKVVFAESRGEPYEGKIAVASVILNRATNPKFPNTIEEVIKQKNAFSCVRNGIINVTPDSDSYNAVNEAIKGSDPTEKALFFYNPKIATCSWMKAIEKENIKIIGQHVFFNIK